MRKIIIPGALRSALRRSLSEYKITFLCAGAGWGKTAAAKELLKAEDACFIRVERERTPRFSSRARLVVLDDFQNLDPRPQERLTDILRRAPGRQRFLVLSRGPVPAGMAPGRFTGELHVLDREKLALRAEDIGRMAQGYGITLPAEELRRIAWESRGYPPLVRFVLERAAGGGLPVPQGCSSALEEVWSCLDIYLEESRENGVRELLLALCHFSEVSPELAGVLRKGGEEAFFRAVAGGMLISEENGRWSLADRFLWEPYLRRKAEEELSPARLRQIHLLGGAWCVEHGDYAAAVDHFGAAESRRDVISTLEQAVRGGVDAGCLIRLRPALESLTPEEAVGSPELLSALCRVKTLALEPEKCGIWRDLLRTLAEAPDGRLARGCLLALDLRLPCREEDSLSGLILTGRRLAGEGAIVLPPPCVCGLPSILRGERDLSEDLLHDSQLLAPQTQRAAEQLLGRYGVGLGALLRAELCLERGEENARLLLQWHSLRQKLREWGTMEHEFVCVVLMARLLCAEGQLLEASACLTQFRCRAEAAGAGRLLENLDALCCRLSLMEDSPRADSWLAGRPAVGEAVSLLDIFPLLTRVRCHIRREEYRSALLILGCLLECTARRPLDAVEAIVLTAVCRFHMGGEDWREYLRQALDMGGRYGYTQVFAREGAALLPLLEQFDPESLPADYWRRLVRQTITQAGYYPLYLKPLGGLTRPLTAAERTVLRLLLQHRSDKEMAQLLGIRPATVRSHLRNLFGKLGVRSREEACAAALRLELEL